MTARTARTVASLAFAVAVVACGTGYYEIPIETPIKPKLDVTPFQRVLVAGFIAGGSEDVDGNLETVRLLRSQLRTKSQLRVIDADPLPLVDVAAEQSAADLASTETAQPPAAPTASEPAIVPTPTAASEPATAGKPETVTDTSKPSGEDIKGNGDAAKANGEPKSDSADRKAPQRDKAGNPIIKDDKDLEPYERIFANTEYWKKIGEEYQQPLIVTGTVMFTPHSRSGFVQREQEVYDSFGRRRVVPVRTYQERKGFILRPKFVFIDGRTGATLYSETFREEILYNASQSTPALSSYFELMDRLLPSFLSTLSSQKIRGTRVLLK